MKYRSFSLGNTNQAQRVVIVTVHAIRTKWEKLTRQFSVASNDPITLVSHNKIRASIHVVSITSTWLLLKRTIPDLELDFEVVLFRRCYG